MKASDGFTLLEVLISMIVLAIGLLGMAALHANSLKNTLSAYHRSQATQLTYDMADRIRANQLEAGNYPTVTATAQASCTTTATCSPSAMAQNDLYEWNTAINSIFPEGNGSISKVGTLFTIAISWDDNRNGSSDSVFSMSFKL